MFHALRFGVHVMLRRRNLGLTIREMADQIGINYATICRIERGKHPEMDTFASICIWAGWKETCGKFFVENPEDLNEV